MNIDLILEFSEIRSLMNLPHLDGEQRRTLWDTIKEMALRSPDVYASEWLPYLKAFPHHWQEPLFTTFSTRAHHLPELLRSCELAPFACFNLNISSHASTEDLRALLCAPIFARVHSLTSHRTPVPAALIEELATHHATARLLHLHLEESSLQDDALAAWLALPKAGPLQRLILPRNALTSRVMGLLIANQDTLALTHLDLSGNSLNNRVFLALANPVFQDLTSLNLSSNSLTNRSILGWLRRSSLVLNKLTHLDLSDHRLSHETIALLCEPHRFPDLTHLVLRLVNLDDRGVMALLDSKIMARLSHLDIRDHRGFSPPVREALSREASLHRRLTFQFS